MLNDEEILLKLIELSNPNLNENTIFIWPEGVIPNINLEDLKNNYNIFLKTHFQTSILLFLGLMMMKSKMELRNIIILCQL